MSEENFDEMEKTAEEEKENKEKLLDFYRV